MKLNCENKSGGNENDEKIKWTIERERNLAPGSITHKWPNHWWTAASMLLPKYCCFKVFSVEHSRVQIYYTQMTQPSTAHRILCSKKTQNEKHKIQNTKYTRYRAKLLCPAHLMACTKIGLKLICLYWGQ